MLDEWAPLADLERRIREYEKYVGLLEELIAAMEPFVRQYAIVVLGVLVEKYKAAVVRASGMREDAKTEKELLWGWDAVYNMATKGEGEEAQARLAPT